MNRKSVIRIALMAVGIAVWGYGQRSDQPTTRLIGIGILAVALLLRFVPTHWFDDDPPRASSDDHA